MAKHKTAPISEPSSATLPQQLAAISVAISVGCLVEANVGGTLRRVLGIKQQADGDITLLYHNEARQMVVFFVKPGGRLIFKVTLAQESEAKNDKARD